ncbi:hypothetical protein RFI_02924, partial [Reticulomyxa filosa]
RSDMNKIGILAILVVFFPFVSLALPSTNRLEEHLKIATQYYKQGNPALAEAEFTKAIELDPKNLTYPVPHNIYSADEFDPSLTPTREELENIVLNPRLPTNAAELEEYKQDLKRIEEEEKEAERAEDIIWKITILKSKLPNLNTGITTPIFNTIDEVVYALGLGKGEASQAHAAFQELQMELGKISEMPQMSDADAKMILEMSTNPGDTFNSIKERLDAMLANAKIKQTKAEAKEAWLSKNGKLRGFENKFNLWLKNQKVFSDIRDKEGKIIRRKFNENSLNTWSDIFNPTFSKKRAENQPGANNLGINEINAMRAKLKEQIQNR